MKKKFNLKYFFTTLLAYLLIIVAIDSFLNYWFELSDIQESIIEVFSAIIIYQVIEEIIRRYKSK
jgi:hypothetical protein